MAVDHFHGLGSSQGSWSWYRSSWSGFLVLNYVVYVTRNTNYCWCHVGQDHAQNKPIWFDPLFLFHFCCLGLFVCLCGRLFFSSNCLISFHVPHRFNFIFRLLASNFVIDCCKYLLSVQCAGFVCSDDLRTLKEMTRWEVLRLKSPLVFSPFTNPSSYHFTYFFSLFFAPNELTKASCLLMMKSYLTLTGHYFFLFFLCFYYSSVFYRLICGFYNTSSHAFHLVYLSSHLIPFRNLFFFCRRKVDIFVLLHPPPPSSFSKRNTLNWIDPGRKLIPSLALWNSFLCVRHDWREKVRSEVCSEAKRPGTSFIWPRLLTSREGGTNPTGVHRQPNLQYGKCCRLPVLRGCLQRPRHFVVKILGAGVLRLKTRGPAVVRHPLEIAPRWNSHSRKGIQIYAWNLRFIFNRRLN